MKRGSLIGLLLVTQFYACGDDSTTTPAGNTTPTASRNGLVAEYLLSGNANDSQGVNHGVPSGGPVLAPSRFGAANRAYLLDGVDDVITTATDDFASGNNVSVSLWFNVPSVAGGLKYFVMCSDFGVFINGATAGIAISIPSTDSAQGAFTTANTWHHLLGTYDGSDIRCYLDGVLVETTNHPGDIADLNRPLTFGVFIGNYWNGTIDDVRIYNRTITSATEISNLYHEGGYAQ